MKKIKILSLILAAGALLTACDNDFLQKIPKTELNEANAFLDYNSYKYYMYPCYGLFSNTTIQTSYGLNGTESVYNGDYWAGYLSKQTSQNAYAFQNVTPSAGAGSNGWSFGTIRRVNIMLNHVDEGVLKPDEAAHWRAVGYFFHSFWYAELINRFGDVPWVDKVLTDESPELYNPRTPRKEVADKVLERLIWAEANIDKVSDGANMVNGDVVRAFISRFALREGTWRKYHGLGDHAKYFEACAKYSEMLMPKYPTLYTGVDVNTSGQKVPAAGYGELFTTDNLIGVPGVILCKVNDYPMTAMRFSDYEHISSHNVDMPKHTVDMYLCKDGKTIYNSPLYAGDKDPYATFRNRDPRLYHVVQPPFRVIQGAATSAADKAAPNLPTDNSWHYTTDPQDREYIDLMGVNNVQSVTSPAGGDPSRGMKRLPTQNWGINPLNWNPHLTQNNGGVGFQVSATGFYVWKFFATWEQNGNTNTQKGDLPIFKIEEVLLNYAECKWEQGQTGADLQATIDKTINLLRRRAGVADMKVAEIDASFDPKRGTDDAGVQIDPVLWEIRRERMIELMGEGFGFYDVRRWKCAKWYINRQTYGMWVTSTTGAGRGGNTGSGAVSDLTKVGTISGPGATPTNPGTSNVPGYVYIMPDPVTTKGGWLDQYYLYCVPTAELMLNPNLSPQNPGWPDPNAK